MLNIYYDTLSITWESWREVPIIIKLTNEMCNNNFEWWGTNWNDYLSTHYGISGDVIHSCGYSLRFNCVEKMDLFILHFL